LLALSQAIFRPGVLMLNFVQWLANNRLIAAENYRRTNDGRYTRLHVTSVDDIRQRENQEHDRRGGKEEYATHFMAFVNNAK
jgi:hypothetical protein